jgi:endogenous inhibitor of DNA gyrase (YacG/DUF329 family)
MDKGYRPFCSTKCSSPTALKKQWSGEKGKIRKENLSKKMMNNDYSCGRPKGSVNKNPYPKEAAYKRLEKNPMPSWAGKIHTQETKQKMSVSAYERMEKIGLPRSYKGKFSPKNPQKYQGDPTNIIYRSSWEKIFFKYCDETEDVLSWASEELYIPYISPKDGRRHRYFPDVLLTAKQKDGSIKTIMVEIKPKKETKEPKVQSQKTKRYINEVVTWGVNQAKWKSAQEYCDDKGYEFRLITEDDLGLK